MMRSNFFSLTKILTLSILLAVPHGAQAGTKDGGGTNLVVNENELVDFAKFRAEFGDKQFSIDPRTFKLPKSDVPVFEEIKSKIARMENLYPGSGVLLDGVFEKPWLVVNAEFGGRIDGEKKVISQTGTAVFVSLPWLKKATPEQVQKAFVHEAVRNFSSRLADIRYFSKIDHRADDDQVTEILTPVIYGETLPGQMVTDAMNKARDIHLQTCRQKQSYNCRWTVAKIASRKEIYEDLALLKVKKAARLCSSSNTQGLLSGLRMSRALKEFRADKDLQKAPVENLVYRYRNEEGDITKSLDSGAQALIGFAAAAASPKSPASEIADYCQEAEYRTFLRQLESDSGKAGDATIKMDRLPEDETEGHSSAE